MPKCTICKETKEAIEFPKGNNRCRPCHKQYQRDRRAKLGAAFKPNMDGEKVCSTCHLSKPKTEFGLAKGISDGFQTQCNECRKSGRKVYNDDLKGRLKTMTRSARTRADEKGRRFEMSSNDLLAMWTAQGGKCKMTGLDLVLKNYTDYSKQSRHPDAPSIDRIDSEKGYEPGNIQLVTTLINVMKGNHTDEALEKAALAIATKHGYTVIPPTTPCTTPTDQATIQPPIGTPQ